MRRTTVLLVLGLALVSCCTMRFLHPLFATNELSFDPALVGSWTMISDPTDSATLTVTRATDSLHYELVITQRNDVERYRAGMGRLGKERFWDVMPSVAAGDEYIPIHQFWRVRQNHADLHLSPLNEEWLTHQIARGTIVVAHDTILHEADTTLLITAATVKLQALVTRFAQDSEAFPLTEVVFRRNP